MSTRNRIALCGVLGLVVGCGDGAPPTYPISGTVRLGDEPVANGQILLVPTDSGLDGGVGNIENGTFAFDSTAGDKKVVVLSTRVPPGMTAEQTTLREEYLPEKYRREDTTDIEIRVWANGENRFEIVLDPEGAPPPTTSAPPGGHAALIPPKGAD